MTTTSFFYDSWGDIHMPLLTCNYDSVHISSKLDYSAFDWTGEYQAIPYQSRTYPKMIGISTYNGDAHSQFRHQFFVAKYHTDSDDPDFYLPSNITGKGFFNLNKPIYIIILY